MGVRRKKEGGFLRLVNLPICLHTQHQRLWNIPETKGQRWLPPDTCSLECSSSPSPSKSQLLTVWASVQLSHTGAEAAQGRDCDSRAPPEPEVFWSMGLAISPSGFSVTSVAKPKGLFGQQYIFILCFCVIWLCWVFVAAQAFL